MINQILKISILAIVSFFSSAVAADENKQKKELPKSGSLSESISGISASRNVPGSWGGIDAKGDDPAPITGSVSKITPTKWQARVFNNSEDTYTVNLAVNQYSRTGTKIKSDSFSYTLRSKGSAEREIPTTSTVEQCSLDLVSWTKKEGSKK